MKATPQRSIIIEFTAREAAELATVLDKVEREWQGMTSPQRRAVEELHLHLQGITR